VLFGPLLIGALVVFSAAFYATFFSDTWLGIALRRAAPQVNQPQPEYG
jgi:hypothetical protein